MESLKTLTEAAAILNIDGNFLFELLHTGEIPCVLIRFPGGEAFVEGAAQGDARIDPKDLKDFIGRAKHAGFNGPLMADSADVVFPHNPLFKRANETAAEVQEHTGNPFGPYEG